MEERPKVKDLVQQLKKIVFWEQFAENLPKIEQYHIKMIKAENKGDIDGQKRALFNNWLAIYPGAKYFDVIEALKTAGETTLADDVRKWLEDRGQATQMSTRIEETDSREMDDIPDVSKHCPKVEDIDKTLHEKFIENLTKEEEDIIKVTKFILVTATDIEYRAVMGQATSTRSDKKFLKVIVEDRSTNFILGNYGESRVAVIQTGTGPDKTEKIIKPVQKVIKAEYVIAIGICFGAKKSKTDIGDIIVAESIIDTTEKRHEGNKTIVIPETYFCGKPNLFKLFIHDKSIEIEGKSVKIHLGPLASEKTLYRSAKEKEEILGQVPKALGGEMEANGIRKAVDESEKKFEWIVIKAIVDWGDEAKDKKSQPFGAVSCARYVLECLTKQPNGPPKN